MLVWSIPNCYTNYIVIRCSHPKEYKFQNAGVIFATRKAMSHAYQILKAGFTSCIDTKKLNQEAW